MRIDSASLGAFLRANQPLAYCLACLALKLRTTEGDIRDAAQILVLGPRWALIPDRCHGCQALGHVLSTRPALRSTSVTAPQ